MRPLLALLPLLVASAPGLRAQSIKPLIDSQNFVFQAKTAQPLSRSAYSVANYTYTLKITKDKITCNLPYSGNVHIASDQSEGVLQFTADKFSYKVTPRKDGWKLLIRPRTNGDLEQIQLVVGADGFTTVQATFSGRDAISFEGLIVATDNP